MIRSQPLYQRVLGSAWNLLRPEIRQLHCVTAESTFTGECRVDRGRQPFAWLIASWIGLPVAGAAQEISVRLVREGDGERWIRRIGKRCFASFQDPGYGVHRGLIRERFGPVVVYMALVVDGERLCYVIRKWRFLGIPLPLSMGPRGTAIETVAAGRFHFFVEIRHVLAGLIVRYQGTLSPNPVESASSIETFSP